MEIENTRLKLALTIPPSAPITVANDAIKTLPVVLDKTINDQRSNIFTKFFAH